MLPPERLAEMKGWFLGEPTEAELMDALRETITAYEQAQAEVVAEGMRAEGYKTLLEQAQRMAEARKMALEWAHGAVSDAIYLDDGLDRATGKSILRIIVEAMEQGTFEAPGPVADFLTKRERAMQEQLEQAQRRLAWLEKWKAWREDEPLYDSPRYSRWLAAEPGKE